MTTHPLPPRARLLLASQKVMDFKVPPNRALLRATGVLRRWAMEHDFMPSNKITATVKPVAVEDGSLTADVSGRFLSSELDVRVRLRLPLGLPDYQGPLDVVDVFSQVPGARIDNGGNIQNMALNLATAARELAGHPLLGNRPLGLTVASSSDPFDGLDPAQGQALRGACDVHLLDIPDRFSLHLPYEDESQSGTLVIASEPSRTNAALGQLLSGDPTFAAAFRTTNCFVSADPIYDQLAAAATPPYRTVVNPTTAFRTLVAVESYNRAVLLPMNNGEASDVCKLLLQRGLEEELENVHRPPFPSPLTTDGEAIDPDALAELDRSIDVFARYIPHCRPGYTCPISFGEQGGLIVAAGHETIACFTSTPSPDGERALLDQFAIPDRVRWDRHYEVGAGDAVASVITLFNAVRPRPLLFAHMKDRERENRRLEELAGAVFVSLLGRLVGTFLLRTDDTYWSNIRPGAFPALLEEAAGEAVQVARPMVKAGPGPVIGQANKWGIQVVTWRPGSVAFPDRGGVFDAT